MTIPIPVPSVEVYLSRSEYRVGTTVVGTVRLLPFANQKPRQCYKSASVQVIGKCRIDPRWHNAAAYYKRTNTTKSGPKTGSKPTSANYVDDDDDYSVCTVWETNVVDLLKLPERQVGQWRHVRPQPLKLPPENPELYFTEESLSSTTRPSNHIQDTTSNTNTNRDTDLDSEEQTTTRLCLENQQLTFTFRANLSEHLPPTVSLACCRYYYHVRVEVMTWNGSLPLVQIVPFRLGVCGTRSLPYQPHQTRCRRPNTTVAAPFPQPVRALPWPIPPVCPATFHPMTSTLLRVKRPFDTERRSGIPKLCA